jgi:hypothetical protein
MKDVGKQHRQRQTMCKEKALNTAVHSMGSEQQGTWAEVCLGARRPFSEVWTPSFMLKASKQQEICLKSARVIE